MEVLRSRDYLAVFQTEADIRAITPDFELIRALDCLGLIVTAAGDKADFVSRFFAPRAGIPEDPVTGSAHCTLAPYWAAKLGKSELQAIQLSPRGGALSCRMLRARVEIAGQAVLILEGAIRLPE